MSRTSPLKKIYFLASLLTSLVCAAAQADKPAGLTAQSIKLPSGPASLTGLGESFSANLSTGTGSFSIPIEVAPGFLKPELALSYAAGQGKGALGLSFDLPVLHIYRSTDKGTPRFDENDRFSVSGPQYNDELVRIPGTPGHYRLKNEEQFARFIRVPARANDPKSDSWIIQLPNGETIELGATADSKKIVQGRRVAWYISGHKDHFHHEVSYTYSSQYNQIYLEEIRYQLHKAVSEQAWVSFAYQDNRPDSFTDYRYGQAVVTARRMSQIRVWRAGEEIRRYVLKYAERPLYSLLTQVLLVARPEQPAQQEMRPVTFRYIEASPDAWSLRCMAGAQELGALIRGTAVLEDVTQDGLPDLLVGRQQDYAYFENMDGTGFSKERTSLGIRSSVDLARGDATLADIDGDGRRDVVYSTGAGLRYQPALGLAQGRFLGFDGERPLGDGTTGASFTYGAADAKMDDANHDGRIDLLKQFGARVRQLLNLPNDTLSERDAEWDLPSGVNFADPSFVLQDFNGDTVLDIVQLRPRANEENEVRVWYGVGAGRYLAAQSMGNVPPGAPQQYHFMDVNRDGQTDLVRLTGTWGAYYLNNGRGAFTTRVTQFDGLPTSHEAQKVLFADMNGNGSQDVVWVTAEPRLCYLDMLNEVGVGLVSQVDNGMGLVTDIAYRSSTSYAIAAKWKGQPWKTPMPFPAPVIAEIHTTDSLDRISSEFESSDTHVVYEYADGYYDGREREFRGFGKVVMTEVGDAEHDTRITENYLHVGFDPVRGEDQEILKGRTYLQRVLSGDKKVLQTVETQWERRWLCQEDVPSGTPVILPSCSAFSNEAERIKAKDALVAFAVQKATLMGHWEKTESPKWIGSARDVDAFGNVVFDANYGLVSLGARKVGDAFALTNLATPALAAGGDETITRSEYVNDVADWLLGVLVRERKYALGVGDPIAQTRTFFDGNEDEALLTDPSVLYVGRATMEQKWLDATQSWLTVSRAQYNGDGMITQTEDAKGNTSEFSYDPYVGMLPASETILGNGGMRLTFSAEYRADLGVLTHYVDPNGNESFYEHDSLARITEVTGPDGKVAEKYRYTYGTPEHPLSVTVSENIADPKGDTYRIQVRYSDGLGRTRLEKVQAEDGKWVGRGYVQYSMRGAVARSYDPFVASDESFHGPSAVTPFTRVVHDGLDRVLLTHLPANDRSTTGFTEHQYLPLEVQIFDERNSVGDGRKRFPEAKRLDGMGRVREVVRYDDLASRNAVKLSWLYDYDALGHLAAVSDPNGETRSYLYDSLGRLLELTDPNLAVIEYQYDEAGNEICRRDSKGQVSTSEYGASRRLLARHFFMQGTCDSVRGRTPDYSHRFSYDVASPEYESLAGAKATNVKGQLAKVEFPTGSVLYSYDAFGHLETEVVRLWDGKSPRATPNLNTFVRKVKHDRGGRPLSMELPEGFLFQFDYNERFYLSRVRGGFGDAPGTLFDRVGYNARGQLLGGQTGTGLSTCRRYDARGEISQIFTGALSRGCGGLKDGELALPALPEVGGIQNVSLQRGYDSVIDQVRERALLSNGRPSFQASYEYDWLGQLTRVTEPRATQSYAYDEIQNMASRTLVSGTPVVPHGEMKYGEGSAGPNMLTSMDGSRTITLAYDIIGQLTSYNGYDLTFDPEGRLVRAESESGRVVELDYDAFGDRRIVRVFNDDKQVPQVYRFVFDEYEERDGDKVWRTAGAGNVVEFARLQGVRMTNSLNEDILQYANREQIPVKPLPQEYLDLDGNGLPLDASDLRMAADAAPSEARVGGAREVLRYYHVDHQRSVTHVTDGRGDLVSLVQYDVSGAVADAYGMTPLMGFAGTPLEPEENLRLLHMGTRYYAPEIGRWISPDLHIGENPELMAEKYLEAGLYSFGRNAPNLWVDPSGEAAQWHHLVPRAFHKKLAAMGWSAKQLESLNSAEFGWMLDQADHQGGIHSAGWNKEWDNFFDGKRKTPSQVKAQLAKMMGKSEYKAFLERGFRAEMSYGKWDGLRGAAKEAIHARLAKHRSRVMRTASKARKALISSRNAKTASKALKIAGRLGRKIPVVGLVFLFSDIHNKGFAGGVANTALDQIPVVGWAKAGYEIYTGEDLIPDS